MKQRNKLIALLLLFLFSLLSAPALGSVADFYRGKVIDCIVRA